ncbi:unnamed protein product [Alopecurus aequalis]
MSRERGQEMNGQSRRPPLEDDDLLSEILLRLPPQPSSLPRAAAVSKRWRSLASDPRFSRRFRAHHRRRNPPLVGYFVKDLSHIHFQPALESPNRLPQGCFSFPIAPRERFLPLGCRHGLALILSSGIQLLAWDPCTGEQHLLDIPPGFDAEKNPISAAVFRQAAGDIDHFQVALVGNCERQNTRAVASVYSSETGVWGDLISTQLPYADSWEFPAVVHVSTPAVMIGNSLYWLLNGYPQGILEFDLAKRGLALIPMPVQKTGGAGSGKIRVTPAEGGGLGFLCLTGFCAESWKHMKNSDGAGSWVLQRSIELDKLLSLSPETENSPIILGFADDNNMVLLRISVATFSVQLESLQFKKLFESNIYYRYYPFEGVYTAEKGIDGGHDGAELLQNT